MENRLLARFSSQIPLRAPHAFLMSARVLNAGNEVVFKYKKAKYVLGRGTCYQRRVILIYVGGACAAYRLIWHVYRICKYSNSEYKKNCFFFNWKWIMFNLFLEMWKVDMMFFFINFINFKHNLNIAANKIWGFSKNPITWNKCYR